MTAPEEWTDRDEPLPESWWIQIEAQERAYEQETGPA